MSTVAADTAPEAESDHSSWKPKHNPWLIAVVVTLAAFMEVLDTTIVNVALPHIAGSLGSSYDDATWALTSYLVANGIVLTISSWLSRFFGRKRYFLLCIFLFTVTSFLCGLSTSLPMLIFCRLLQGFFGGGLQPCQQSIILDTFPPEKRGAAFGLTAVATVVGPVLGPMVGGWLTDNYSWRWIFYVNVPFGIITVFAVMYFLEDPPWEKAKREKIDVIGIGLISLALGCIEVMTDRGEDDDWFGSPFIIKMALIGGIGFIVAIVWLLKVKNPLVRLSVFKDRNFTLGTIMMGMLGVLLYASAVIVPQFAQQVQDYTATISGRLMAPGGVTIIILIPVVSYLMKKIQLRYLIAFGFICMAMGLFFSAVLYQDVGFPFLVMCRIMQTAPLAFLFVPISTFAYSTLPRELNGDASALFSMVRNYFGSLSISLATAAIIETKQVHQTELSSHAILGRSEVSNYLTQVQAAAQAHGMSLLQSKSFAMQHLYEEFLKQVSLLAYNQVFNLLGIITLCIVPLCFLISPSKGGEKAAAGGH